METVAPPALPPRCCQKKSESEENLRTHSFVEEYMDFNILKICVLTPLLMSLYHNSLRMTRSKADLKSTNLQYNLLLFDNERSIKLCNIYTQSTVLLFFIKPN